MLGHLRILIRSVEQRHELIEQKRRIERVAKLGVMTMRSAAVARCSGTYTGYPVRTTTCYSDDIDTGYGLIDVK